MKKKYGKKVVAGALATAMVMGTCTACGSSGGSDAIKLGVSMPMSGTIAANGEPCVDAIKLAVKQYNEDGGIGGTEVEVVAEDDEGAPTSAASIANKFADNEDIKAVISSFNSSCMLAQVDVYDGVGLSSISPVATTPQLTGCSDYFYRTAPSDSFCGSTAADFLYNDQGIKKVALFYENDDYGLGIADAFKAECDTLGLEIVTEQTYVYGETVDFSTQLTATASSGAEAIFIAGCVTEQGMICDQRKDYGCGDMTVLVGNGAYTDAFLSYDTEGVYVQGEFDTEMSDKAKQFVSDFEEEYGYAPGNWEASSYDAACIALEAMKNVDGDVTRDAVNEEISKISYEGVCGTYTFENCDCSKDELIFQVVDGKYSLLQ